MSKDNAWGYFEGTAAQFTYRNPWLAEKTKGLGNFFNDLGAGLRNAWYNLTGQTEKTSAYQAQIAREDSAPIRQAEALQQAGLSKYTGGSTTVGTGSYGDGKPTALEKSIQLASALMDLKTKKVGIDATQAGIRKSDAEVALLGAQTLGQENTNRTFDQKIIADINQTLMQTAYIAAQKKLLEDQSPFIVEKTIAEVQHLSNQSALYLAQKDLAFSQSGYYGAQKDLASSQSDYYGAQKKLIDQQAGIASIERSLKQKDLEKYEFRFTMEKEKHAEAIAKSIAERNHLSNQDSMIVKDLAYRQMELDILEYNLNYSKEHGLRTNDNVSRFMGINVDSTGQMASDLTRNAADSVLKLFLPSNLRSVYDNLGF